MTVGKICEHGLDNLALCIAVPTGATYRLVSVSCKLAAAPTTSEDYTITLDARGGEMFDTLLYSVDPSVTSDTDLFWQPDNELLMEGGDSVAVAFTNTDATTYGVQVTLKRV